jgi:putative ABC transport system substrate-binding protein
MRRRALLLAALGAAAGAARPAFAQGQQADRVRRIGVLMISGERDPEGQARSDALREGLQALGWTEGRNIRIDWRWGEGDAIRIRDYAAELVGLAPDALVATGTPGLSALRQMTSSVPIVFVIVNDPIAQGLVPNLARPGGNSTGFSFFEYSILGKLLELLAELAPRLTRIALLFNPANTPYYDAYLRELNAAPQPLSVDVTRAPVGSEAEIETTMAALGRAGNRGLVIPPDPFTSVHRGVIMRLAAQHRLPAIYAYRQVVREGGLISYGPDTADIFRRSAAYVDRVLKGTNPADLPVQAPTKFELAINLKTAQALDLDIPPALLARADEVIE